MRRKNRIAGHSGAVLVLRIFKTLFCGSASL
jgi:hypothetical protein